MVSYPAKDRAPAPSPQVTFVIGVMKYVSSDSLESYIPTLCILVYAIPRHLSIVDTRIIHIDLDSMLRKVKWVPILGEAGRASATSKGTTALIVGNKIFREFGSQTDLGLGHLGNSISRLENKGSPTELWETRPPFYESGRIFHGLRRNLVFPGQPLRNN